MVMLESFFGRQQQRLEYGFLLIACISTAAIYLTFVSYWRRRVYNSKWVGAACTAQLVFSSDIFSYLAHHNSLTLQKHPTQEVARRRKQYVGYNTTLLYTDPLHIVEGKGCKLYSAEGREYLDCANNVAHVGHSHPRVRTLPMLENFDF